MNIIRTNSSRQASRGRMSGGGSEWQEPHVARACRSRSAGAGDVLCALPDAWIRSAASPAPRIHDGAADRAPMIQAAARQSLRRGRRGEPLDSGVGSRRPRACRAVALAEAGRRWSWGDGTSCRLQLDRSRGESPRRARKRELGKLPARVHHTTAAAPNRYTPANGRVSRVHREGQSLQPPFNGLQRVDAGHRRPNLRRARRSRASCSHACARCSTGCRRSSRR